jgi:hypothetical protein
MRRSDAIGQEPGAATPDVVRDLTDLRQRLGDWRGGEA